MTSPDRPRRHPLRALTAACCLLTLPLLAACGVDEPPKLELPARAADAPRTPAATPADAERVAVDTVVVAPRHLAEEVVLTGELRAAESVALRAETSGRAVSLHFAEGQAVSRGQLLVKINDAELVAERKRTALRRDLAAQREKRLAALVAEGTISQELYDESANELSVFEAELALFDTRIAETEVRAPFDGVVGLRAISVGSHLTPQVAIATLQALDPMKLDITVSERYAGRIHRGDALSFTVAGIDREFAARVFALEPRIDAATRTMLVRAEAQNPGGVLLPGAFAKVRLVLDTKGDALMVPSIALVPGLEATTVFVVEGGVAASRQVRTGRRTAAEIEILAGLAIGDEVIVKGIQSVRPGTPVVTQPQATATSGALEAGAGAGAVAFAAGGQP